MLTAVSNIREDAPAGLDTTTPNVARIYDYLLGGKDNFAADRAAAGQLLAVIPDVAAIAADNRAFLGRAVRYLTGQGIRQFLDLGSGLPTRSNVHEVARQDAAGTRVVYVDYDPVVALHGKALLAPGRWRKSSASSTASNWSRPASYSCRTGTPIRRLTPLAGSGHSGRESAGSRSAAGEITAALVLDQLVITGISR